MRERERKKKAKYNERRKMRKRKERKEERICFVNRGKSWKEERNWRKNNTEIE